jgi:hypothetical protein
LVTVKNPDHSVTAGENLDLEIGLKNITPEKNYEEKVEFNILNNENNSIWTSTETIDFSQKPTIEEKVPIPKLTPSGNYKLTAEINYQGKTIAGEDFFTVKEVPVVSIGSTTLTSIQVMRGLGWMLWLMVLLLLIFLSMLGIEHHLSEGAVFHITEEYLSKRGFISRRKEVSK